MALQMRVIVPPHPLIQHWLGVARDVNTPTPLFRTAFKELGRWLTYEAARDWLPTIATEIQTPLTATAANFVDFSLPIALVPILRAGLGLIESAQEVLPTARIFHLGLVRDEETLQPHSYLNKLPVTFEPASRVLILEPMLATGGSLDAALSAILQRDVDISQVRVISIVAAHAALQRLSQRYGDLRIFTAIIDEQVNEQGFIVPGLGDAGDRLFGT
jgi:uracil phosphoribosyltransferase